MSLCSDSLGATALVRRLLPVLVLLSGANAFGGEPMARRELGNLVGSQLALTAAPVAQRLGGFNWVVPVPTLARAPEFSVLLSNPVWSEATSIPLPCLRTDGDGRIVDDARLLAFRSPTRLYLALRVPIPSIEPTQLTLVPSGSPQSLTISVGHSGGVSSITTGTGPTLGSGPALARASIDGNPRLRPATTTIVMEIDWAGRDLTFRIPGGLFGFHSPNPLAEVAIRLVPDVIAWRVEAAEGSPDQTTWQLTVPAATARSLDADYAACHISGALLMGGKAAVSTHVEGGWSVSRVSAPAGIGLNVMKIAAGSAAHLAIDGGWKRLDTPGRTLEPAFAAPDFDDRTWLATAIPDQDDPHFPVERPWLHYRVRFRVPDTWSGQPRQLVIPKIDDHGWVYLNGQAVGEHHRYDTPFRADVTRLLKPGENVLAVLVKNDGNTPGGLVGQVEIDDPGSPPYSLPCVTYLPDPRRLLDGLKHLDADPEVRSDHDRSRAVDELGRRLSELEPALGSSVARRAWDDTFRRIVALRRETALSATPLGFGRLVFVKRHNFAGHDAFFGYTSYLKPSLAELCVLESVREGGPVRTLLRTEEGCIRDPDVSFDGRRVVFAYARDQSVRSGYRIHEIQADGSGLRALTTPPAYDGPEPTPRAAGCQDVEPCYLPNGDVVFTSTRYVRYVDCVDAEPVTTLFLMDGDGRRQRGISANHVHDWHPSVLNDGRIIYTRWEYTDRSQMWPHKLFVKNPDGSATAAFYGSNSWWPVSMLHARAVPGSSRVLCTLAGHHSGTDQTGEIGLIDRDRGSEDRGGVVALFPPRPVEPVYRDDPRPGPDSSYTEPYPLSERRFIVSGRLPGTERFGLYLADFHGNLVLLYEDDRLDSLSAMPLVPRPQPPLIAPRVDYRRDEATMVLLDVYRGAGLEGVPRGTVKALRVVDFEVRDTPGTGGLRQEEGPSGGHSCPVSALGGSWHVKRIIGTVPVSDDGSAAFRIPAERRIFFQPLDAQGRALQSMRSWVEAMPGEQITCVGCHESRRESPPAELTTRALALARNAVAPTPWLGPPRAFGFVREVQPVLDRHCVRCHDGSDRKGLDLRGDVTNWFSLAYENLRPYVRPIGPQGLPGVVPPCTQGAIASPLVELLLRGHEGVLLDHESLDRIITWIDLNVPYYDNTAVTRPSTGPLGNNVTGSGRAVVADARPLREALGDRCVACHPHGFRLDPVAAPCQVPDIPASLTRPCVNLTHPEESRLLAAPLARSVGGLGLCRDTPFASRDDATYQAALRVIRSWHDALDARPREDMPGSVPCAAFNATHAKRQAWLKVEAATRRELAGHGTTP